MDLLVSFGVPVAFSSVVYVDSLGNAVIAEGVVYEIITVSLLDLIDRAYGDDDCDYDCECCQEG